jgi:hypothetical protein
MVGAEILADSGQAATKSLMVTMYWGHLLVGLL